MAKSSMAPRRQVVMPTAAEAFANAGEVSTAPLAKVKEAQVRFTFDLDESLHTELKMAAARSRTKIADMLRDACKRFVAEHS